MQLLVYTGGGLPGLVSWSVPLLLHGPDGSCVGHPQEVGREAQLDDDDDNDGDDDDYHDDDDEEEEEGDGDDDAADDASEPSQQVATGAKLGKA